MELILFKNAQEAITNAVRHGQATTVDVTLLYQANDVSLTIANDGLLPDKPLTSGLGLLGMKERAALLGGKLEWEQNGKFAVTTILPLLGAH
jgi:two-component system NarL family sensor kinase